MSRAQWAGWASQLWEGLCQGLCETGTFLAMQNGFAMPALREARTGSDARSGV